MTLPKLRPDFTFDQDRLEALRAIAPEAFADGKVNWEALRAALGDHLEDEGRDAEHFGLFWPGKRAARRLASAPGAGTLLPAPGEGVNETTTRHLFIEGDNLEVLKLLQKSYAGRVKMIYIDPPYNTGNDFIYSDNFTQPLEAYLRATGQADEMGRVLVTNTRAGGRYHSNWLTMMYPRLRLARALLRDDGVIFVSIDDNEVHHLRMLMNEVFGEENFVASIAWEKRYTRSNNSKLFYSLKDTILMYRNSVAVSTLKERRTEKSNSIYSNPDNDPRGPWTSSSYVNPATKQQRPNLVYPIFHPFTGERVEHPTHAWKYERTVHERHVREDRLWWGRDGNAKYPRLKVFLSEAEEGLVPVDLWDHKTSGTTDEGGQELRDLFGESVFDNPKPTKLIARMLRLSTTAMDGDIVLDFFAGSCTTAHAVLQLNHEDGGNRRFIMVQLPEPTPPDSQARRAGLTTIADIGKERIRRVIARMQAEQSGRLDLSERAAPEDLGFRVFKLGRSHYKAWQDYDGEDLEALQARFDAFESPLVEGWQPEHLLVEIMLIEGFPLDSAVERLPEFAANTVWRVASDLVAHRLYVCLDEQVRAETIAALAPGDNDLFISVPHFTVEMETGTGKTYVYLRTIHELRQRYGWSKFVIVVPSLAIYEGVIKNVQITRDHFRALYNNEPLDLIAYDGAQLSRLRHFATSNTVTVLLITLDAFNKANNNLYKASEKLPGERRPFQFIQETRPVLILDEPQNMESEKARQALRTLDPLLALRYSATHRTSPNLVYRLTPFDAYQRSLVKRIEVWGVTERDNPNLEFLTLNEITPPPRIAARVRTRVTDRSGTREAEVTLRQGDNLFDKTNREEHRRGYLVENINAGAGYVEFANGERLYLHEGGGPSRPAIFREQIRQTIRRHMERQSELLPRGIKVLSLFFIDRVANYTAEDGLIRRLFDEEYARIAPDYPFFRDRRAEEVRQAYFAQMRRKDGREEAADTESRTAEERQAEKRAFELIMRDKERLLSLDEAVSFIFAHSALKEGWDNPNVFQICTLNQTTSEIKKRQEIGRGLRLCVNQGGERAPGDDINVLTVVANESYHDYARRLQQEYVADGDAPPPLPDNARLKREAVRRDDIFYHNPHFQRFWEQLNRRVRYQVRVDTPALIEECVNRLNRQSYPGHVLVVEKGRITLGAWKVRAERIEKDKARITLNLFDDEGEERTLTLSVRPGDDLARKIKDDRLRSLGVVAIREEGADYRVVFTQSGLTLASGQSHEYTPEGFGGQVRERFVQAQIERYPVFNLIERAARQTGLTRPTVNAIFRRMQPDKKRFLLHNPEGFAGVFIGELHNALADHIAERIEFVIETGDGPFDREALFPSRRAFPQKEVIEAGPKGLYDLVQKDSDVEARYVEAIKQEGEAIVFYFKFPPGFKVDLPALIGDYNPDWGVARVKRNGEVEVRTYIHETKGTTDLGKLQFPHERRKIRCAERYFATIGVTYLTVNPQQRGQWWETGAGRLPMP